MILKRILNGLATCVLIMCYQQSFAKYDPSLNWHTIQTQHFLFHYHDGLEESANEIAIQAEDMQAELSDYFQWTPKARTHVVLSDHIDLPNGSATPIPNNRIEIFMSPPAEIASLEDFQDWKKLVFKHEYVHILHLDKAEEFPRHMRNVVGRMWLFFPNIYLPRWMTEGLATYLETEPDKRIGRGQSHFFRGMMRNEVIHGIKSLDEVNQSLLDWPSGTSAYLYGVYFYQFIRDRYGDAKIRQFVEEYSRFPIPFFINRVIKRTFHKNLDILWMEFENYLKSEFKQEIAAGKKSSTNTEKLTNSGYFSGFSKTLDNGNILTIKNYRESSKQLIMIDPVQNSETAILQINNQDYLFGQPFDVHSEKGILIPLIDFEKNSKLVFDLYRVDLDTFEKKRLTTSKRYIRAIWSPDGKQIIAVRNSLGKHSLELLDEQGNLLKILSPPDKNRLISSLDWSADGKQLVLSVFRYGTSWNLELYDIKNNSWQMLTQNRWIEAHPQFSDDGNSIYYSADYSGIYNIYQLLPGTKELIQHTQTTTIALYPEPDEKNQKVQFSELGKQGFDLTRQDFSKSKIIPNSILDQTDENKPEPVDIPSFLENEPYNGLSYLAPPWWFPLFTADKNHYSIGFMTITNDPLFWHNYNLQFQFDVTNSEPLWSFQYVNTRWYPDLFFTSRRQNFYSDELIYRNENEYSVGAIWPYIKIDQQWNLLTSFKHLTADYNFTENRDRTLVTLTDELFISGISWNTSLSTPRSVSKFSGHFASLSYENNNVDGSLEHNGRVVFSGIYYSPIVMHSVLEIGALAIAAGNDAGRLSLGGNEDDNIEEAMFGFRTFSLKGYPDSSFRGTNLQKLDVQLHVPVTYPQTGIMAPPLGINSIKLHPFALAGRAGAFSNINELDWNYAVGAELSFGMNFGYDKIPFAIVLGAAEGLSEGGEFQAYINVVADL